MPQGNDILVPKNCSLSFKKEYGMSIREFADQQ